MEIINLNLIPGEALPVCHASQYDNERTFRLNLFDGSSVYTLSSSDEVTLSVRKPDGNIVTAEVTHTQVSYVDITTTEQMTAVPGKSVCELTINEIGTLNFILDVEEGPQNGSINSESEISNLRTQIEDIISSMPISSASIKMATYTYTDLPQT